MTDDKQMIFQFYGEFDKKKIMKRENVMEMLFKNQILLYLAYKSANSATVSFVYIHRKIT